MNLAASFRQREANDLHRGFTLIEVLVVVLLVAVTVSFMVVNLGTGDRDLVRSEATRLAASIQHAQDEAVMTGRSIAWLGQADGYRYLRRGPDRDWISFAGDDQAFAEYRLPTPVQLVRLEVAGEGVARAMIVFSPSALTAHARIVLAANSERAAVEVGAITRVVNYRGS